MTAFLVIAEGVHVTQPLALLSSREGAEKTVAWLEKHLNDGWHYLVIWPIELDEWFDRESIASLLHPKKFVSGVVVETPLDCPKSTDCPWSVDDPQGQ